MRGKFLRERGHFGFFDPLGEGGGVSMAKVKVFGFCMGNNIQK